MKRPFNLFIVGKNTAARRKKQTDVAIGLVTVEDDQIPSTSMSTGLTK